MLTEFQKYSLDDFLDDPDFCRWAISEDQELEEYYRQQLAKFPEQQELFQRASQLVRLLDDEKITTDRNYKAQQWEKIHLRYRTLNRPARKRSLFFRYAAVQTALVTITSLTWYFLRVPTGKELLADYNRQDFTATTLVLDNGKKIDIPSDRSEIIYGQGGEQLTVNNELVEEAVTKSVAMNQLIVPYGKQSKIMLSDQTEVWLNAGSRLVYPTTFEGDKRIVKLQGEAYFKVSKDPSKPFIVETNKSRIKVLGTSFNVKAYPDEQNEETVLVEGAVSLRLGKTIFGKDIRLNPEQRLVVTDPDSYSISTVDVRPYTSWIEGLFIFQEEQLPSVLLRISRYYNLQINWADNAVKKKISGKLDLKDDYHRVLNALALISDGNYTEENGIIRFNLKN